MRAARTALLYRIRSCSSLSSGIPTALRTALYFAVQSVLYGCSLGSSFTRFPAVQKAHASLVKMVESGLFNHVVTLCIIGSTTVMALEYEGMSAEFYDGLNVAEMCFSVIFMMEMLLKIAAAAGVSQYLSETQNCFDMLVTITSAIALLPEVENLAILRILRMFRVLRITRALVKYESIARMLYTAFSSTVAIMNIGIFMVFSIAVFAIVGMQLFGGKYPVQIDGSPYRINFDSFLNSCTALFTVMTGENWNTVLYNTMRTNELAGSIFTPFFFMFGNWIMVNLFVAVILENFEIAEEEKSSKQAALYAKLVREKQNGKLAPLHKPDVTKGPTTILSKLRSLGPKALRDRLEEKEAAAAISREELALALGIVPPPPFMKRISHRLTSIVDRMESDKSMERPAGEQKLRSTD